MVQVNCGEKSTRAMLIVLAKFVISATQCNWQIRPAANAN
jgi:hypothetical protein